MKGRIKREGNPRLAFPQIGKIKIGKMVSTNGGKAYPTSCDYFLASGKYEKYFTDVYGEKSNILQVVFLDDDPGKVCDERLELRNKAGQLVAWGDGILFQVHSDKTDKYHEFSIEEHPEMLEKLAQKHSGEWRTTLTMRFLLPKISGIIGYWELTTKGENSSIPQIVDVFDQVKNMKGFVKGILFDLHVHIHKSNKPGSKSRYPVITLVPNHSKENKALISSHFKIDGNENLQSNRLG